MIKNLAGKVAVFAWNSGAGAPKIWDAANITAQISLDGGASQATNDANPAELDAANHPGVYVFDLLQAETNADLVVITPKSTTAGVVFKPVVAYPTTLTPTRSGYLDAAVSTRALEAGGNVAAIKTKTDNLPAAPAVEGNIQGHVADALAAYDPPTKAELDTAQAALEAALGALNIDLSPVLEAIAALENISVAEILAGNLADDQAFPAGSLADRLRKLFWVLCNKMQITDATGAFTAYQDDGLTPAVTGAITDDHTTTERSAPAWP